MTSPSRLCRASLALLLAATLLALPARATVEDGVEKWRAGDYRGAVMLWLPAAARGNAHALFNLGLAHRQGRGVPRDLDRAEDFFRRAAEKGHPAARSYLGILLARKGETAEAITLWQQAARQGSPHARYMLGIRYLNGKDLPKDLPLAYAHISLAARSGLAQAQRALPKVAGAISETDSKAGQALAAKMAAESGDKLPDRSGSPAARAAAQVKAGTAPPPTRQQETQMASIGTVPVPPPAARPVPESKTPPPAATQPVYRVQLGAYGVRSQAEEGWTSISRRQGTLLAGLAPVFVPFDEGVRLRVGAFSERGEAAALCQRLQAAGQPCFVSSAD